MTVLAVPARPGRTRWSDELNCYEVQCAGCHDWWPCDTEFWHEQWNRDGRVFPRTECKACRLGRYRSKAA